MTSVEPLHLPLPEELIPRKSFRPAGTVLSAQYLSSAPKFPKPGTTSRAQRLGKRYEAKVYKELKSLESSKNFSPDIILYGPWISFLSSSGSVRSCQPDVLIFEDHLKICTVCEIKYSHTIDAYHQLRRLYLPVMQKLHPTYEFRLIELTKSYDGAVKFPEEIAMFSMDFVSGYMKMLQDFSSKIGIIQWKL